MAGMSGDTGGGKAPKYLVPILKFNGNTGEFKRVVYTDGQKEEFPVSGEVSFVILKNRKRLEAQEAGLSSVEFNSPTQIVTLFSEQDGKYQKEAVDTVANLRSQYPVLKTQEVLYILFEGEIHKLVVKGGSSRSFYDYKDSLKSEELHSFMVNTIVKTDSAKSKMGKKYFFMKFEAGAKTDLDEIEQHMQIVDAEIRKIDAYNSGKAMEDTGGSKQENMTVTKEKSDFADFEDGIDPDNIEI